MLLMCSRCCDCDDCGDLSEGSYGIINGLNMELTIRFLEENNSFEITLNPSDTSELWTTIVDPVGGFCGQFFVNYESESSFPLAPDEIIILTKEEELKTFFRCQGQCPTPIFIPEIASKNKNNELFYRIDSVNLCLN